MNPRLEIGSVGESDSGSHLELIKLKICLETLLSKKKRRALPWYKCPGFSKEEEEEEKKEAMYEPVQ